MTKKKVDRTAAERAQRYRDSKKTKTTGPDGGGAVGAAGNAESEPDTAERTKTTGPGVHEVPPPPPPPAPPPTEAPPQEEAPKEEPKVYSTFEQAAADTARERGTEDEKNASAEKAAADAAKEEARKRRAAVGSAKVMIGIYNFARDTAASRHAHLLAPEDLEMLTTRKTDEGLGAFQQTVGAAAYEVSMRWDIDFDITPPPEFLVGAVMLGAVWAAFGRPLASIPFYDKNKKTDEKTAEDEVARARARRIT